MKRLFFFLVIVLFSLKVYTQSFEFGIRDSQFAKFTYVTRRNFYVGFEQSILNVKVKEQNGLLFAGYKYLKNNWKADGCIYGGTEYDGRWWSAGTFLQVDYFFKSILLSGTINYSYDSGLKHQFSYDLDVGYIVWKRSNSSNQFAALKMSYGNIPEYRENVKYLRIGTLFRSGNLWVQPEICVPGVDNDINKVRVLCNLGWEISL